MCATGALLANNYGLPALFVKLGGVFLYGYWIVFHQLDIRSESYPLVRLKYIYLLVLVPLLLVDLSLQTLYIAQLKPDIITSCCAVVFSAAEGDGRNLLGSVSQGTMLELFYGSAFSLAALGVWLRRRWRASLGWLYAGGWGWFLGLSLVAVITVFSAYIYAMPFHHCPFCILKPEYDYIGFVLYGTLLLAAFFGIAGAIVHPFRPRPGLERIIPEFQHTAVKLSLLLLAIFVALSSYHLLLYRITGGES